LSCEICDKWFHARCVNIKEDAYKILQDLETCHWFCDSCNNKVGNFIPNLVTLHEKISTNEKAIARMENEIQKNNGQVVKRKSDVNKMTNELNNVKTEVDRQLVEIKSTLDKAFNGLDVDSPGTSWAQVASEHVEKKLLMVAAEVEEVNKALQNTREKAKEG